MIRSSGSSMALSPIRMGGPGCWVIEPGGNIPRALRPNDPGSHRKVTDRPGEWGKPGEVRTHFMPYRGVQRHGQSICVVEHDLVALHVVNPRPRQRAAPIDPRINLDPPDAGE